MSITDQISAIQRLVMAQQFDAALTEVSALTRMAGNDPSTLALHAHILRRLGRANDAIELLARVIRLNDRIPNAWLELARCHQMLQNLVAAREAVRSAIALQPDSSAAHALAFDIAELQGDLETADSAFQQLLRIDSRAIERRLALGNQSFDRGDFDRAAWHFAAFVKHAPSRVDGYLNLAAAQAQLGALQHASETLKLGIRKSPNDARLLARLCELDEGVGETPADRIANCQALLQLEPGHEQGRFLLACAHLAAFEFEAARRELDALLATAALPWPALWVRAHYPANPVYPDIPATLAYRAELKAMITQLETDLADGRIDAALAARMLASCPNYFLGYLNDLDLTLPVGYAAALRKLALQSGLRDAEPSTTRQAGEPVRKRVVIVSAHLWRHSVSRVWRDLLCALPRDEFELRLADLTGTEDDSTQLWRSRADHWETGSRSVEAWRDWIAAQHADVIVYPDIGMEPITQALACVRLAPIQVTTWGHPVSTGQSCIDFFLGSNLAEPEGAEKHYSERLVRIAGLAASYRLVPPEWLGFAPPKQRTRLVCLQNAFKLMPEQDDAFVRILDGIPDAELYLLASSHGQALQSIETRLRQRLTPEQNTRLFVLGFLDYPDYHALLGSADLALDSWGWSGGLTSLDALCLGVPVRRCRAN
ncbi:MAG: tetratricopeptide repeat protein [Ahniella sp.]|nr:tetratricopeptide repeat protein [Ahniella sp.]